jgi:hypothetical protein
MISSAPYASPTTRHVIGISNLTSSANFILRRFRSAPVFSVVFGLSDRMSLSFGRSFADLALEAGSFSNLWPDNTKCLLFTSGTASRKSKCFSSAVMQITGLTDNLCTNLAKFLMDRVLENRNKIKNFKCNVEYRTYRSTEVMREQADYLIKRARGPLDLKALQQQVARLDEHNEHTFEKHGLALDNEGKAKVEMVSGMLDKSGNLMKGSTKRISTWDGQSSIRYSERPGRRAALLSDRQPTATTKSHRQPWQTFGGIVCDRFVKAVADGTVTNVERMEDGTYRIEFLFYNRIKNISVIDPSQGYSITLEENYENGQLAYRAQAKFQEVSSNIWFSTVCRRPPDNDRIGNRARKTTAQML